MMKCSAHYFNMAQDLLLQIHLGLVKQEQLDAIAEASAVHLPIEDLQRQMQSLTIERDELQYETNQLTNKIERIKMAFPLSCFNQPNVVRCMIQPVLRLLSALLTVRNNKVSLTF